MLSFRAVNCKSDRGYRDDWQRHHIFPRQLATDCRTEPVFARLRQAGFVFDDFDTNGILLPATVAAATRSRLPLHAGPHPDYNRDVAELILSLSRLPGGDPTGIVTLFRSVRRLQRHLRTVLILPRATMHSVDCLDLRSDHLPDRRFDDAILACLDGFAVSPGSA